MNALERSAAVIDALIASGVEEFIVCAGARNAPLIAVLSTRAIRLHSFFEERSAAFFALGRSKATGQPVAVVTTSGTAAAELLPAAIEAHYGAVPLVLLTADRPHRYRGTGAPQAIEQRGLFGPYAAAAIDVGDAAEFELPAWSRRGPLHVNVALDEPLMEGDIPAPTTSRPAPEPELDLADPREASKTIDDFLAAVNAPLILVGELRAEERDAVRELIAAAGAPAFAEPLSGLREDRSIEHLLLRGGEAAVARLELDAVLRIGGVPTVRLWRDLDEVRSSTPLLSVSSLPFSGIPRGEHLMTDLSRLRITPRRTSPGEMRLDRKAAATVAHLFAAHPAAEPSLFRALSNEIPAGSLVYLGNSLPIREWDLAATRSRSWMMAANRGANGIDGQLSTFFGMVVEGRESWCIVGDLTALYDLAAPWALSAIEDAPIRIVVVNNGGGRIFSRVRSLRRIDSSRREALVENPHDLSFKQWAEMWGLDWRPWRGGFFPSPLPDRVVIEIRPDAEQTTAFWDALDSAMEAP